MQSNHVFKLSVFDPQYINPFAPLPPQLKEYEGKRLQNTIRTIEAVDQTRAILIYLHGHLFQFKEALTKFAIVVIVEKAQGEPDFIIMDVDDYLRECNPEFSTLH